MILDIVFVRHGLSCANAWGNKFYGLPLHLFYRDPELTLAGIATSKDLSSVLINKVAELWWHEPYSIGSSSMIRAQQTSYHMLASILDKPIHIMAHTCEAGLALDSHAYPVDKQRHILEDKSPGIGKLLSKGLDGRGEHNIWNKSSFSKFLVWASVNPEYFELGSDGHYRAVIFTHSHFLKYAFHTDNIINNNNAIHTIVDTNDKTPVIRDTWYMNQQNLSEVCPNDCYISHCDYLLKIFFLILFIIIAVFCISRIVQKLSKKQIHLLTSSNKSSTL